MAKESIKARDRKRVKLELLYHDRRAQLKKDGDWVGLQKLPRNSSKVRQRNRCQISGRPRGYMRQFGLCRNQFRDMALAGKIPGVTKCSW
jgi:small subunit ribosomal protein S14